MLRSCKLNWFVLILPGDGFPVKSLSAVMAQNVRHVSVGKESPSNFTDRVSGSSSKCKLLAVLIGCSLQKKTTPADFLICIVVGLHK